MTPQKSARSANPAWSRRDDPTTRFGEPGSLPIRAVELAMRNPVTTGGIVVSILMVAITVANAVGNQPARHPHPFFDTRTVAKTDGRTGTVGAQPALPPMPAGVPNVMPRPKPVSALDDTLVQDLQLALHDRGWYTGPVDGVIGPATAEAIRAFERRLGTTPTGEASELLLAALRATPSLLAGATPAPVQPVAVAPAPKTAAVPAKTPARAPAPARQTAVTPISAPAAPPARVAMADAVAYPAPDAEVADYAEIDAPVSTGTIRRAAREPLAPGGDERLQKIQRALVAAGYGPLKADGRWDDRTTATVRRYEVDRGWAATGKPSDRLVYDLMVKGAPVRR